jgi:diphthamide biosynthesis protein 7
VATSTGSIVLYRLLNDTEHQPHLEHYRTLSLFDPSLLVLSFTWCTQLPYQLGVSLSNGEVYLVEDEWLANAGTDETASRKSLMMKHDLEAWTLAFSPSGQGSFSGGDDIALRYCSTLPGVHTPSLLPSSYNLPARTWGDDKLHTAGITAILPLSDQIIVTGSYDDRIRIVSAPNPGRRKVLKELNLGGGVWRLKLMAKQPDDWQDEDKGFANFTVLASCMHAGARIVRLCRSEGGDWGITVLARFEEHKSMNYGSDFQPVTSGKPRTIVSTSFYDKLLSVWHFDE